MGKDISCKVLKLYGEVDKTEYGGTHLVELSWGNRPCKGVDIRKYDKEKEMYLKGINVSYDGLTKILLLAIENNLVDIDEIKDALNNRDKRAFDAEDYQNMIDGLNSDNEKYKRNKYGMLVTKDGNHYVVHKKR